MKDNKSKQINNIFIPKVVADLLKIDATFLTKIRKATVRFFIAFSWC
jgi:hypothetical protein